MIRVFDCMLSATVVLESAPGVNPEIADRGVLGTLASCDKRSLTRSTRSPEARKIPSKHLEWAPATSNVSQIAASTEELACQVH